MRRCFGEFRGDSLQCFHLRIFSLLPPTEHADRPDDAPDKQCQQGKRCNRVYCVGDFCFALQLVEIVHEGRGVS